ncbi:MAG: heavy metal translocating P-type ATPase metal-binding domain-containing protein [Fidelibacterota bacterium]|nr:MAG: heavy metal translocating P-type ATPase metal-binding domain-containing protein [Candidatus Neomarinimicrobiota bacterium]
MSERLTGRAEKVLCYHCGDICGSGGVTADEKHFCCTGCRTVYEILRDNELTDYYQLEEDTPGISLKRIARSEEYRYLDNPDLAEQLLDFSDGELSQITLKIPGMHCASCIWLLERLDRFNAAIIRSMVHFPRKEVTITYRQGAITLRELVLLIAALGYQPLLEVAEGRDRTWRRENRRLYYQIGIAGFAFGNIMLYSFPEYVAAGEAIDPLFRTIFGYLSVFLSLPVLLYSSIDYFRSAWNGLRQRMLNIDVPITLGIVMLYSRSLWEIITASGAGYLDSFSGLVFFLLIGKLFQKKTYQSLAFDRDYRSYFPLSAAKLEDGREVSVPLAELQPGDRFVVRNRELVPVDSLLIEGEGCLDYSFVTGESDLGSREEGDLIYAGGRQIGAAIQLEALKEVSQSQLTRLWNNDIFTKPFPARLTRTVNEVSKYFTAIILAIALAASAYWLRIDAAKAVHVFTAVLIVACPCALALSSPFALGTAQRILGRNRLFLKNAETVETLARIDTIVFDKTGTLTYSIPRTINFSGEILSADELRMIKSLTRHSTHPLSRSIHAVLDGPADSLVHGYEEVSGKGIRATVDGKLVTIGSREWVAAPPDDDQPDTHDHSRVYLAIDRSYRGAFLIPNKYRPGLKTLLTMLKKRYLLHVLSGDTERDSTELRGIFGSEAELLFRQTPEDKLRYIHTLQDQGRHVLMVGDGLNDAGALKASEAGISVSEDINAFSPACDGILTADSFGDLPRMLRFTHTSMAVILASFGISFVYNLVGLSFAVAGLLTPLVAAILMPASSITVVAFATLATKFRARMIGMGA